MKIKYFKQNLIYIVLASAITLLVFSWLPQRQPEPRGIYLPLIATPSTISVNTSAEPTVLTTRPAQYQVLGNISVMMALPSPSDFAMQSNATRCLEKAKALAQEAGATSLVVLKIAHYTKESGLNATVLYAEAIKSTG